MCSCQGWGWGGSCGGPSHSPRRAGNRSPFVGGRAGPSCRWQGRAQAAGLAPPAWQLQRDRGDFRWGRQSSAGCQVIPPPKSVQLVPPGWGWGECSSRPAHQAGFRDRAVTSLVDNPEPWGHMRAPGGPAPPQDLVVPPQCPSSSGVPTSFATMGAELSSPRGSCHNCPPPQHARLQGPQGHLAQL